MLTERFSSMLKPNIAGDVGPTPGRTIKSFLWLVVGVTFFTMVTTYMHTPEAIAINGLYMIGLGGLFAIGGQQLVNAYSKKWGSPAPREEVNVATTTTSKKVKQ